MFKDAVWEDVSLDYISSRTQPSEDGYVITMGEMYAILKVEVVFQQCTVGWKEPKLCQENIPHGITLPSPLIKAGWIHSFMLLTQNPGPEYCCSNWDSLDQTTFSQFWWTCVHFDSRFIFVSQHAAVSPSTLTCCTFKRRYSAYPAHKVVILAIVVFLYCPFWLITTIINKEIHPHN